MPATAMLRLGLANNPDGRLVKFGWRFVEPACSNSVTGENTRIKMIERLTWFSVSPHAWFLEPVRFLIRHDIRTHLPYPNHLSLVAPNFVDGQLSCCHCRTYTYTAGPSSSCFAHWMSYCCCPGNPRAPAVPNKIAAVTNIAFDQRASILKILPQYRSECGGPLYVEYLAI